MQITEPGAIVSDTYDQFLTGNGDTPVPPPTVLLSCALPALALVRRMRVRPAITRGGAELARA
jgi:hypothetical protein